MANPTYTVQRERCYGRRSIFTVLADDISGFDAFVADRGAEVMPGSKIDIADLKVILRLRNDGNWEQYEDYATAEERAEIDATALETVLDGLLPEEG